VHARVGWASRQLFRQHRRPEASNADSLKHWGLAQNHLDVLRASVPATVIVSPNHADVLWRDRRNLFFKPARGDGSKAAYRGDKVTRKVWAEIIEGEYVAQSYAAAGTRVVQIDETRVELKVDTRLYTFAGTLLLAAARLYQGQTTNMRTPGGKFAPVLEVLKAGVRNVGGGSPSIARHVPQQKALWAARNRSVASLTRLRESRVNVLAISSDGSAVCR
jgi:hypothetical protein